jgi:hypothetical protein
MKDAEHDDDQVEDAGEATFGDLVRANAPKAIDVSAAFEDAESKTLVQSSANNSSASIRDVSWHGAHPIVEDKRHNSARDVLPHYGPRHDSRNY